jgi:hypothetical protein
VSRAALAPALLVAAFALALGLARARSAGAVATSRLAAGLVLGALCAHLGWALLHLPAVAALPLALLDPTRGFCALFVPLGVALAAPRPRVLRDAYLDASLPALPLALALARLGCLLAGCCHGVASDGPLALALGPGGAPVHATPLYECAALVALHALLARAPRRARAGLALAGLGAVRLAVEPLRAAPPLGEPLLPTAGLALGLVASGVALLIRSEASGAAAHLFGVAPPAGHADLVEALARGVEQRGRTRACARGVAPRHRDRLVEVAERPQRPRALFF